MQQAPSAVYSQRLEARARERAAVGKQDAWIANLRLVAALGAALVGWWVVVSRLLAWYWLLPPVAAFALLAILHERTLVRRRALDAAIGFYEDGLARLESRWPGRGRDGARFLEAEHPYARDLDIFGPGSLFQYLTTARTRAGEQRLASWLLAPSALDELRERQVAVSELRPELDLREDHARLLARADYGLDPEALSSWGKAPLTLASPWLPWVAGVLAVLNVACIVAWFRLSLGAMPLLPGLLASGLFALVTGRRLGTVHGRAAYPAAELKVLAGLMERLEGASFNANALAALQSRLRASGANASSRIRQLGHLVEWSEARRNAFFAFFGAPLLVSHQLAFALERWRRDCGGSLESWLASVGEFEAFSSLAAAAYEHPLDPFAELVPEPACFEATALRHPLLAESLAVGNDVALGPDRQLLLVSGSNMSGKSTLLRSVGVNGVLALAGATVRARSLRSSVIAIGASLRVEDSLLEGTSRFYQEIRRLRDIVDSSAGERPLLFLLDEILQGTNSHDRQVGAAGLVCRLIERGAFGLVTTHDLALSQIVEALGPRAANVHFADEVRDGKLVFDFRLKPGLVDRSNALELMRQLGLDV